MLVLTRKVGEQIIIKGNIRLTVVGIESDRVRLGVTAPRETPVDRQEIHERRMGQVAAVKPSSSGGGPQ